MSKKEIVFRDRDGNVVIKCDHIETGRAKLSEDGIKIYGSSRVTPAIGFDYPEHGTKVHKEKLDKDPLSTMIKDQIAVETSKSNPFEWNTQEFKFITDTKQVARVYVNVEVYENQKIEINENNELVVKIGKVKLGGCK